MKRLCNQMFIPIIISVLLFNTANAQKGKIKKIKEIKFKPEMKNYFNSGDPVINYYITYFNHYGVDSLLEEYRHNTLVAKTIYSYDIKHRLIEGKEYVFDQEKDSLYSYEYFYNSSDSLVLEAELTDGNIDRFIEYQYSDNMIIKKKTCFSDNLKVRQHIDTILLDTKGRTIKELCSVMNSSYEYDSSGNEKLICFWGGNYKQCWTYEYIKFDNQNNWIERKEYLEGKFNYLVKRKIEYY